LGSKAAESRGNRAEIRGERGEEMEEGREKRAFGEGIKRHHYLY